MQAVRPIQRLFRRQFSLTRALESRYPTDLFEPDYLSSLVPDYPIYDNLTIQIKGYDFPILESFHSHVYRLANLMNIDVEECWGTPGEKFLVQRYKPLSSSVNTEYNLTMYERNIQITDVASTIFPVFLRMVKESTPEGVSFTVKESNAEEQNIRYVPDNQLLSLKQQLDDLGGPRDKKKK